jgi:hypothetical protein
VWAGSGCGPRLKKRKEGEDRWAGGGIGLMFFFFFFKSFSNLFKPFFYIFSNQILTQISPTTLKAFDEPFLITFQTFFVKSKPSIFFNSNFYTNFHNLFHNYFKDFSQNFFLRLLESHHKQNSCIST